MGMIVFWFERASSIDQVSWLAYLFLSGSVIAMRDMPKGVAQVLYYTPFPYCIDFPATILTGQLAPSDPAIWHGFAASAAWITGLSMLGAVLWRRGLRQYSGQGA